MVDRYGGSAAAERDRGANSDESQPETEDERREREERDARPDPPVYAPSFQRRLWNVGQETSETTPKLVVCAPERVVLRIWATSEGHLVEHMEVTAVPDRDGVAAHRSYRKRQGHARPRNRYGRMPDSDEAGWSTLRFFLEDDDRNVWFVWDGYRDRELAVDVAEIRFALHDVHSADGSIRFRIT